MATARLGSAPGRGTSVLDIGVDIDDVVLGICKQENSVTKFFEVGDRFDQIDTKRFELIGANVDLAWSHLEYQMRRSTFNC